MASASRWLLSLCLLAAPTSAVALDLFADLLYWKASEETSLLWASSLSFKPGGVEVFEGHDVAFDWDLGFRVGLGQDFGCGCFDVKAYWTWLETSGCDSVSNQLIETQFFGGFLTGDVSDGAKIDIELKYQMFDGEVGKSLCLCDELLLRPYLGVKGGWIDQTICSEWQNFVPLGNDRFTATEKLTNDFWGVGPEVGIGIEWGFGRCLHLYSDLEAAFLWGTWKNTDSYENSHLERVNINTKNSQLGSLTLRGFLGLGFETRLGNVALLLARLGYEGQIWFSQFRIATFQQLRVHGDLSLQGGTLNITVAF